MIDNIFNKFVVDNELYVNELDWSVMKENHTPEFIIQSISDAIELFKIKLPYRVITEEDYIDDFNKLVNLDVTTLTGNDEWGSKFEYKYHFNPHYINSSTVGGKASDYFHQVERWKCDATGYPSPQKTWENEKYRLTLFKALFSLKVKEINPTVLRNLISLRKYIASQFRPSTAKYIYEYFNAESVLDFSMGWGDRLLGAYASSTVKKYVGFDPNINLIDGYLNQCKSYGSLIDKDINIKIHPNCAEDESISLEGKFDLIFTSPPYYDKEKYNQSTEQSYIKYKKFDDWMDNFLCKTIDLRSKNLKSGGYLVINISDIYTRKKLYQICDIMNDYILNRGDFTYEGAIGFKMPKRPMSKSTKTAGVYGEPIWVWKKK